MKDRRSRGEGICLPFGKEIIGKILELGMDQKSFAI